MNALKHFIQSHIHINEDDLEIILSNFTERTVLREKFVLTQGHIVTEYFFIVSGGLRLFFTNNDKQVTAWIALENDFFTDLSSVKNTIPSRFNMQAIEDTVLLTIKHDSMEALYNKFPQWQQFGRKVWETAFLKVIDAIINYQTMTAEERYLAAMEHPEFLQRIPLKHLSSFLGITPTSLSRLRKNIK